MVLFIGDRPAPNAKTPVPFKYAKCEKRLAEWIKALGVTDYKLINSASDYFDLALVLAIQSGVPLVALGNNASKAIGRANHFKLPHPSGRNRQINDKEFISEKLSKCKLWLGRYK